MEKRALLYVKSPSSQDFVSPVMRPAGWEVHVATRADAASELMANGEFLVALVQWDCPIEDRENRLRQTRPLLDANSDVNWIALIASGVNSSRDVCQLIATHFYAYHTVPLDSQRLLVTVGQAHGMAAITRSNFARRTEGPVPLGMVGRAPSMRALYQKISKFAAIDLNVLIHGQSGTGKELAASAIHRLSDRSDGPFVAVNCGALPRDLIQTELFGHEKGSFTGADRRRVGRIEAAQGGTLFLDEIGDLPLDLQVNLLRFLQEKTIDRLGGSSEIPVDVRVIAATNANLERAVEEGRFREDLYYRLNVLRLDMPSLNERGDDKQLLAEHFLHLFARSVNPNVKGFSEAAMEVIKDYPWPGNVREMVNRIQRAVVMCEGRRIRPRDLGLDRNAPNSVLKTLAEVRAHAEKEAIKTTLAAVRNNVSRAARHLGVSRVTLYRLMEQHAVDLQRERKT
jgi:DNA-binding NtrC family response regulator